MQHSWSGKHHHGAWLVNIGAVKRLEEGGRRVGCSKSVQPITINICVYCSHGIKVSPLNVAKCC